MMNGRQWWLFIWPLVTVHLRIGRKNNSRFENRGVACNRTPSPLLSRAKGDYPEVIFRLILILISQSHQTRHRFDFYVMAGVATDGGMVSA